MRRIITLAFAMAMSMTLLSGGVALADDCSIDNASSTTTALPAGMEGLDGYISILPNGTIGFDSVSALEAGYSADAVAGVAENIQMMNGLLTADGVTGVSIGSDYSLTIVFSESRANGVSKIVTTWYGYTQIWMDSDEAQQFLNNLGTQGNLGTVLGWIPGADFLAGYVSGTAMIYSWQVQNAINAGDGSIIMHILVDPALGTQSIWFTAQP